jgi:hypothetical protein
MSKITPVLQEINGYSKLVSYYEKNKDKPWKDWLSFEQTFDKPGKQGLVGILKATDEKEKTQFVFKISQYINYLAHHELVIMQGLNELSSFCPHYCKSIGSVICQVDPKSRKTGNPFKITTKYPIEKEALLCEFIDKSCKFYNYIRAVDKIQENVLYSTIKQVLMAISIAQKKKNFSHYDLHSNNIMMKKCNKDVVFLYVLDEENQLAVPTHGHYPVIIDFGFSYISDVEDGPMWMSMAHTDVGFTSDRFDWVADPKLFLVTVSGEIKEKRNTKKARRLRRIVKNIFFPLKIDWESGWDDVDEQGASDHVTELLKDYNEGSELFQEYDHYCMDILQSLIILPIEEQDYSNIHKSYTMFLKEWKKIENEISSPFYNLYILKGVVDSARHVRAAYARQNSRKDAIKTFREKIYERINKVSQFCRPKNINFEKILCSLLVLSKNMEGVLHDVISPRMIEKEKEYKKLPLKTTDQIFAAIQSNIPDEYEYSDKTTVFVFDCIKEETGYLKLDKEQVELINKIHPLCQGTAIYDIYKGSK